MNPAAICQSLHCQHSKVWNKLFPATSGNQDFSGSLHATLLAQSDRSKATTELVVSGGHMTSLHFHKIEVLSTAGHDVYFAVPVAQTLTEDLVTSL